MPEFSVHRGLNYTKTFPVVKRFVVVWSASGEGGVLRRHAASARTETALSEVGARGMDDALRYAERGWLVLPLRPREKVPLGAHGLLDATTDPTVISAWPDDANIGIRTGAVSGIVVLDADAGHGGLESLDLLRLPETATVLTGGGGLHYYFAHPGHEVRNATGLLPGIDLRGDGGYVVAPRSTHPNGNRYEWEVLHDDTYPLAAMPTLPVSRAAGITPPIGDIIPAGQRHAELVSLAGSMRRRGMNASEILAALRAVNARCVPPSADAPLVEIAASVARYAPAPRTPRHVVGGFQP